MPAEAAFSITAKGPNQELVTVRGDSWTDLLANATSAGVDAAGLYARTFKTLPDTPPPAPTHEQAVQTVAQSFDATPLPQPGTVAPGPAASPGGSCAHGVRVWKDTAGKGGQPWRRWECSIPWRPNTDNSQRCKAVNVT